MYAEQQPAHTHSSPRYPRYHLEPPDAAAAARVSESRRNRSSPSHAPLACASLAAAANRHGARPISELALVERSLASLEGVPLWTVTNEDNEFVLLSQGSAAAPRQLGLFCFNEADAGLMLQQVKGKNFDIAGAQVHLSRRYQTLPQLWKGWRCLMTWPGVRNGPDSCNMSNDSRFCTTVAALKLRTRS